MGGYEKEKRHGVLRALAFWFLPRPTLLLSAFGVYETSILIPSHNSPRAEARCSSWRVRKMRLTEGPGLAQCLLVSSAGLECRPGHLPLPPDAPFSRRL